MANLLTTASIKKWFERISSDPISLSKPIMLVLAGFAIGAIVGLDTYLATFVDEYYWSVMFLYELPFKVSLVTAVLFFAAGLTIAWASKAREFREIQIVAIVISMQLVSIGAGGVDPIDVLTVIFTILIIAYALSNPTNPIRFPLIMFFALAIAILDIPHATFDKPVHFLISFIKYSKSAILPLILVYLISNERLVRIFVKALIAVAFVSACIGIMQVIVFTLTGIPLILVDKFDDALKPTPWGVTLRAHGLNPEVHTLSTFLLIALPFSLYAITRGDCKRHYIISGTVALTIIMGIFLTWSYGGIVSVLIILGLFPLFMWPNKSLHYLLALLMIPVFLYFTDLIIVMYEMLRDEASMSTGIFQRKQLALITFEELSRNPWIGRGFGTVPMFSGNYMPRPVHNAYMEAWAAIGPIGFLIFTSMLFIFTTHTFILGFRGSGEQEYRLRMITLVLISFMVLMISEPMLFSASTWIALGFAQALILLYGRNNDNSQSMVPTLSIERRVPGQQRKKHKNE